MAANTYKLSIDLANLGEIQQRVLDQVAEQVEQGIRLVAEGGASMWRARVKEARLWEGEKEPYIASIKWDMDGPFAADITADYKLADEIETGRPAKDLKKMLRTSQKTRVSTSHKGQKYLIIPIRHNTPGNTALANSMPKEVYAEAKQMKQSRLLPPGSINPATRLSGSGHMVARHSYEWNGRLPAGLSEKLKPYHKTDIYAGMVRMKTNAGLSKSSAYLTFRVMAEWQSGWVVESRPGLHLAQKVSEDLQPLLDKTIGKAIDLAKKAG